jgi:anaerobic selenocysteine-containing dehydrogenase
MHCLFRDGAADREFLEKFTDAPRELEAHLRTRSPEWASGITGCPVETIEAFARLVKERKRAYFRLGYGFARSRNGAVNMHAASCIAAVRGSWRLEGGGAFHNNGAIYHWNKTITEGHDAIDPAIRMLDQSRIGPILVGERDALIKDVPITALLIQNTNPVSVAPEQDKVKRGFARDDLFVCVHEQFMTETAQMADVVLPATMFMEHDDMYQGGGHQYIQLGMKLVDPPGECRSNHDVICALARRLGAQHEGFDMTPRQLIDRLLGDSGWGTLEALEEKRWIDCQPDFDTAHYTKGFAWPDGKFRFKPDWTSVPFRSPWLAGPVDIMPALPDHWEVTEEATAEFPFRLATSPARNFLNSTFNETPTSIAREHRPTVMIHPEDAAAYGIANGAKVVLGNTRGEVRLHAKVFDGVRRGVLIAESIWPNSAYEDGRGINTLTGADAIAPYGGAAFHDNRVWVRVAAQ